MLNGFADIKPDDKIRKRGSKAFKQRIVTSEIPMPNYRVEILNIPINFFGFQRIIQKCPD